MKYKNILVPMLFIFISSLPVSAAENVINKNLALFSDKTIQEHQLFIEERLDFGRRHAAYWQNGWTGLYSISMVAQGILSVTENHKDDRVKNMVGALKSAGALADMLLRPLPGRYGANTIREMPTGLRRLDRGEQLLQRSAKRAGEPTTWKPHLKVLAGNLLGAALIAGFGDPDDALTSTALGIAVGEAAIWSQPRQPETDLRDYRNRYPIHTGLNLKMIPFPNGIAISGTF